MVIGNFNLATRRQRVLKEFGQIEASREAFQRAIKLDKNGPVGKNAAMYIRARLTRFHAYYANAWNNLSLCYKHLGNALAAADCRQRAQAAMPVNLDNLYR